MIATFYSDRGHLIKPHGDRLCNLLISSDRPDIIETLKIESIDYPSHTLTVRQNCDLELLLNGAFSPLTGFMTEEEYKSVIENLRLPTGLLWPIPITLDVNARVAESLKIGQHLALRDQEGFMVAVMKVEALWQADKTHEAVTVYGTDRPDHPGVAFLNEHVNNYYAGGSVEGIQLPMHHDFKTLRLTPSEVRAMFTRLGWRRVVAFQTRMPLYEVHRVMTLDAAKEIRANLLIHPVVGTTKPRDIDYYTRVRCYKKILEEYLPGTVMLNLLPLSMRMAGPREALWHALIQKNYGCTHFIIGSDHAGPGKDAQGNHFYDPYKSQELVQQYQDEIGIQMIPYKEMVYVKDSNRFMEIDKVPENEQFYHISGAELKKRLVDGIDIPPWLSSEAVTEELRKSFPPKNKQGFTVFFTGLSGSGKSTIANVMLVKLRELGTRPVTLLDGDIVRLNLSKELGFSREHRDINIKRIGFVASEITKNRGIAICAPIAPYLHAREHNRALISQYGGYIEVYVSTPIDICEQRDRKGLYAKARKGIIKEFTGVSDPYEVPTIPEIILDTTNMTPDEAAQEVLLYLEKQGYI
jgi:sulfate adenylyltransferase